MKNKTFVSVPITQEIIEKLDKEFYFCLDRNNEETLFNTNTLKEFPNRFKGCQILIEQPLPIGKTAEQILNDSGLYIIDFNSSRNYYAVIELIEKLLSSQLQQPIGQTAEEILDKYKIGQHPIVKPLFIKAMEEYASQLQPSQVGKRCEKCGDKFEYSFTVCHCGGVLK